MYRYTLGEILPSHTLHRAVNQYLSKNTDLRCRSMLELLGLGRKLTDSCKRDLFQASASDSVHVRARATAIATTHEANE
jgi:hypothetical protein